MRSRWLQRWGVALAVCLSAAPLWAKDVEVPQAVDTAFRHYVMLPQLLRPILEKVQDKESADAAAPTLQNVLGHVYDARRDLNKIASLSPDEAAELRRRYEADMRAHWGELYRHILRLQQAKCYESPAFARPFSTLCMLLEK